ncbi:MAG: PIG-L family deacetylase [Deltaproteobacteria bacterium]|nr:PIG-L family deacetylase [Deltaproteobacteria bacterium]
MRLEHVRRAFAIGAHPDDVEVGAGGLVAKLVASGAAVTLQVASIPNRYAIRKAEAERAAKHLGVTLVLPPEERETRVEELAMHELVARFERELATADPELVILHQANDVHHDHHVVHRAAIAALRRSRADILVYATRLPPGAAPPPPTCVVDITSSIDRKLAAVAEHTSQFPASFAETRRDVARALGYSYGVAYAEVFEVLRISL